MDWKDPVLMTQRIAKVTAVSCPILDLMSYLKKS